MDEIVRRLGRPDDGPAIEKVGAHVRGRFVTARARFMYWKCGCMACEPIENDALDIAPSLTLCERHRNLRPGATRRSYREEVDF